MTDTVPFLWYHEKAEEAARFYVSLLPDSRIDNLTAMPADSPSGPAGSVKVVEFTLAGRPYYAMEAKGPDTFNHAVSIAVTCDTQAEIDRLWDALSQGGATEACGWLKDRYGLSWQIMPKSIIAMMRDPDRARGKRVAEAMMRMVKLEIAELQRAYDGAAAA